MIYEPISQIIRNYQNKKVEKIEYEGLNKIKEFNNY